MENESRVIKHFGMNMNSWPGCKNAKCWSILDAFYECTNVHLALSPAGTFTANWDCSCLMLFWPREPHRPMVCTEMISVSDIFVWHIFWKGRVIGQAKVRYVFSKNLSVSHNRNCHWRWLIHAQYKFGSTSLQNICQEHKYLVAVVPTKLRCKFHCSPFTLWKYLASQNHTAVSSSHWRHC